MGSGVAKERKSGQTRSALPLGAQRRRFAKTLSRSSPPVLSRLLSNADPTFPLPIPRLPSCLVNRRFPTRPQRPPEIATRERLVRQRKNVHIPIFGSPFRQDWQDFGSHKLIIRGWRQNGLYSLWYLEGSSAFNSGETGHKSITRVAGSDKQLRALLAAIASEGGSNSQC
jgi:hypothetical protein